MEPKKSDAKAQALRLLTVRDRSVQELRDRLQRQFAKEEIEEALDYLERIGYLDDLRFAKNHVQYRNRQRPTGNYLMRLELRSKGVRDSYIEQVLNPPEVEYELALSLAKQRLGSLERVDALARMRRMFGLLQRRGFPSAVARRVVCELLSSKSDNVPKKLKH